MFCGLTSNVLAMDKLAPWCLGSNLMNSLAVSRALGSASAQRTLVMVWANEDVLCAATPVLYFAEAVHCCFL